MVKGPLPAVRVCKKCVQSKPLDAFPLIGCKRKGKRFCWYRGTCKVCDSREQTERNRLWRRNKRSKAASK